MEKFNLLANRMTDQPPFHAAVELQKTADGWFYGYLIILKESFRRLPLPVRATAATAQRGEISREKPRNSARFRPRRSRPENGTNRRDRAAQKSRRDFAKRKYAESAFAYSAEKIAVVSEKRRNEKFRCPESPARAVIIIRLKFL